MQKIKINLNGFVPNVKGQQPRIGKDGRISNQKGAFGGLRKEFIHESKENSAPTGYEYPFKYGSGDGVHGGTVTGLS